MIDSIYLRPRVLLMMPLGFTSGLPLLLTGATLLACLTRAGVGLTQLGLFSLVGLPYSLKFLWAPLLDAHSVPGWRRRGWLLLTQALLVPSLIALGLLTPRRDPLPVALCALLCAVLSATQDIASDAYRADVLAADEIAAGTATYVLGYRVAMIVAGAGALRLLATQPTGRIYGSLALLLLPGLLCSALAPEPASEPAGPGADVLWAPLRALGRRPHAALLLALVLVYRLGDALVTGLLLPFLLRTGYQPAQVADAVNVFGLLATILGVLLGGRLTLALGLLRALLIFGALQAATNLGYALLALRPPTAAWLWAVVGLDHLATGLAVAASGALLLSLCDRRYSATQAALLTSLSGAAGRLLGGGAGWLAERLGWPGFFCLSAALGLPGLVLLGRIGRRQPAPSASVTPRA